MGGVVSEWVAQLVFLLNLISVSVWSHCSSFYARLSNKNVDSWAHQTSREAGWGGGAASSVQPPVDAPHAARGATGARCLCSWRPAHPSSAPGWNATPRTHDLPPCRIVMSCSTAALSDEVTHHEDLCAPLT